MDIRTEVISPDRCGSGVQGNYYTLDSVAGSAGSRIFVGIPVTSISYLPPDDINWHFESSGDWTDRWERLLHEDGWQSGKVHKRFEPSSSRPRQSYKLQPGIQFPMLNWPNRLIWIIHLHWCCTPTQGWYSHTYSSRNIQLALELQILRFCSPLFFGSLTKWEALHCSDHNSSLFLLWKWKFTDKKVSIFYFILSLVQWTVKSGGQTEPWDVIKFLMARWPLLPTAGSPRLKAETT